jgi:hypothetical protein
MQQALKIHKASLKARQEAFKMRAPPLLQPSRQQSPLFEPDHTAPPLTQQSQQEDAVDDMLEEHVKLTNTQYLPPTEQSIAPIPEGDYRKRKGICLRDKTDRYANVV